MKKQTFNSPVFNTAPVSSRRLSTEGNHPLAPLAPTFHIRSNVHVTNYYFVTVAPQAGLAAQQQVNNLPTVPNENCWDKLMKCLRR